jgi:hypothetical protein
VDVERLGVKALGGVGELGVEGLGIHGVDVALRKATRKGSTRAVCAGALRHG